MNVKWKKLLLSLVLIMIVPTVSATSIYRWVDDDGQVHFSSKPKSNNAKQITIKDRYIDSGKSTPALSTEQRVEKQKRFINALDEENKSIKQEKQKQRQQEEYAQRQCVRARDYLKSAERASALYDLDKKGNRVILNDQQHAAAMSEARAQVSKWCN